MTSTAAPAEVEADPRRWVALSVIVVAQLVVILDATIVNIALPSAQRALSISDVNRQWMVTAYTLAFGGLLLLGGRIVDRGGRKRSFVVGLVAFGVASAVGGLATSGEMLFAARALQGAFAALLAPAALAVLVVTFTDARERALALSVYNAVAGGGLAAGLILGGLLTQYLSWRWCLLVNTPVVLIAAVFAVRTLTESWGTRTGRYDVPGAATVTAGLLAAVASCTQAAERGWTAPLTLVLLGVGAALLVAFAVIERRSTNPLLPPRLVADRDRAAAFLAPLLSSAAIFAFFLLITYYCQQTRGWSPVRTGLACLPFSGGIVVASTLAAHLLGRTGPKGLMIAGGLLGTASLAWLTQLQSDSSWLLHILPAEVGLSLGAGLVFVPASTLALHDAGAHSGAAGGLLNATQQIGGSLGTAVCNTLAAAGAVAAAASMNAAVDGYQRGFMFAAASFAAVVMLVCLLSRRTVPSGRSTGRTDTEAG